MKKREMKARIHRLEKGRSLLAAAVVELGEAVIKLNDEIEELRKKRLTREEISEVADRVNRLLTENK